MNNKIEKITLVETRDGNDSRNLTAEIQGNGDLMLIGYDLGDFVRKCWGDEDYEYDVTVAAEYKDTILLWLIKERFDSDVKFKEWLNEKKIPNRFSNWI